MLTTARLPTTRLRSSSAVIARSPAKRSTSPTVSSLLRTDEGSLRVTRMLFIGRTGGRGRRGGRVTVLPFLPFLPDCVSYAPSMSHRLAVSAVVAAHGRFDQTTTFRVAAGDERQQSVAGMRPITARRLRFRRLMMAVAGNRLSHHFTEFLIRDLHRHLPDR